MHRSHHVRSQQRRTSRQIRRTDAPAGALRRVIAATAYLSRGHRGIGVAVRPANAGGPLPRRRFTAHRSDARRVAPSGDRPQAAPGRVACCCPGQHRDAGMTAVMGGS